MPEARKIWRGAYSQDDLSKWEIRNLIGLGVLNKKKGNYGKALGYYQQSLAISEDQGFKSSLASAHNHLGGIYLLTGEHQRALVHFKKAHAFSRTSGMMPLLGKSSKNMAKAYAGLGQSEEALRRADETVQILRKLKIPVALQDGYMIKGNLLEKRGDLTGAEKDYKSAVGILEELREGTAGSEEKSLFAGKGRTVYERLIQLLLSQGKVPEAMKYLERSRLKGLRDQFDQLKPTLNNEAEEEARLKELALKEEIEVARIQLTKEQSKPKAEQNPIKIKSLEKTLSLRKQDYIEFINDLRESFPQLASLLAIQPDTLIDLQALLPQKAAIVQYLILKDRLYAFLVARDTLLYKDVRVDQTALEGKIDYFRSLLMNPRIPVKMGPLETKTLRPQAEAKGSLYDMFIAPFLKTSEDKIKSGLGGYDVLHLATHGKLAGPIKESYILLARSSDGKEDGKLFLREIWGLSLNGYQRVTLSACERHRSVL
jgi:tetratricopeptide (TPR) repeat protein